MYLANTIETAEMISGSERTQQSGWLKRAEFVGILTQRLTKHAGTFKGTEKNN
jgi:hypothetical protein